MALTLGTGPLAPRRAGRLNFEPPAAALLWEPYLPRFRVEAGGGPLADTRAARMLHETGRMSRVFVPEADVRTDRLAAGSRKGGSPATGEAASWSLGALADLAWGHPVPPEGAPPLAGHLTFDLSRVDAWYVEDEKGYAHPRDPYHRVDVLRATRRVVVRLGGEVVAETDRPALLFETGLPARVYLAPLAVRPGVLERSGTLSHCPYKGPGRHWHLDAAGGRVEDAAWSLAAPLGEAAAIRDWVCFYPGKVECEVDGETLPAG